MTPKEQFKLDLKDRKILYQLDVNARQSASEIGRKVGLDKQVVAYRIHRLLEEGAITKFYAVYDTSKLGFTTYKILLRLQNTDTAKEQEIVQFIKNHPHVQFFMSCDGNFDLVFNVLARSAIELNDILTDFENKYGSFVAERQVMIMLLSSFFTREYLIGKKSSEQRKPIYFGSKPEEVKLDKDDYPILGQLGVDARMPLVEIAKKVGVSADTVRLRIRKMEKAQIIHNYLLLPDFSSLGYLSYKLLFSLHNLTKERENRLYEFCRQHPNIWFHSKSLGRWDLEVNLDVSSPQEFRGIMRDLKSDFSSIIKESATLQISAIHVFNFYPLWKNGSTGRIL